MPAVRSQSYGGHLCFKLIVQDFRVSKPAFEANYLERIKEDLLSYQHQHLGWGYFQRASLTTALSLGLFFIGSAPSGAAEPPAAEAPANAAILSAEASEIEPAIALPLRVVLSINERQVYLYEGDRVLNRYPVAVGAADTPTPQGEFSVAQMVIEPIWQSPWTGEFHEPGANSALGLRWIGFTASESGSFGFHGTPTLSSIGRAVSNGCVRMRNEDIVALFSQVSIGTPVVVMP